jgi:hypothetical protein
MKQENNRSEETGRSSLVSDLLYGFFSRTFELLDDAIESIIKEQQKKIFKKLIVVVVFFAGALFLLNALALFISDYLEKAAWVGHGIVGAVLVLLALIFRKE